MSDSFDRGLLAQLAQEISDLREETRSQRHGILDAKDWKLTENISVRFNPQHSFYVALIRDQHGQETPVAIKQTYDEAFAVAAEKQMIFDQRIADLSSQEEL